MLWASISTLVIGLAMLNIPSVISSDLSWTDYRHDLLNTGYVDGTGGLYAMMESYRLHEERNITTIPVSIDLDGDGVSEVAYPTEGGGLVVRTGADGGLVERITFEGNISGSPLVFDHRSDGTVDLVVLVTNVNGTSVHLVRGSDLSSTERLVIPGQFARGESSIGDIDGNGNIDLVFSVSGGDIYVVDLRDFSILWTRNLTQNMAGSFAVYDGNDGPRIAVISNIWYAQGNEWTCSTLFILNGLSGDIEWSYEAFGSICTPPTVVREEPSVWIAFGTFPGNIYVLDVETKATVLELEYKVFDSSPYWRHISLLKGPATLVDHIILFGDRAIALLRISDGSIVWGEFHKYPMSMTDSLVCDIDEDGDLELVTLNESRHENDTSTLRFIDPWEGDNETVLAVILMDPVGLIIADIDDDGALEVLLCFHNWLVLMNEEPYLVVEGVLPSDGSTYEEGQFVQFEVLFTNRDDSQVPVFEWTSDIQGTIGMQSRFVSDELRVGHHIITLAIDDGHGHVITHTLELDVVRQPVDIFDGSGPWLILVIILVVLAGVVVWYWRMKLQDDGKV